MAPTPLIIPALDTARLTLRGHQPSDFDESTDMWSDPGVNRHIGGRPSTPEETWARLLRYAGLWSLLGFGYWAVRERETGRFVGEVGLADFRRAIEPALGATPEAGWVLAPWCHGRGYATEAVGAILAWSDRHLTDADSGLARVACIIAPENAASIRVAQKCGFRQVALGTYKDQPTLVFERHAPPLGAER